MRWCKWCAALIFGLIYLSQTAVAVADDEAVLRAAQAVTDEYKVYATCTALFPGGPQLVQELWDREINFGADYLKNTRKNLLLLTRYMVLVGGTKLYDPQMPLGEAVTYCERNQEAMKRYHVFDFLRMAEAMEKADNGQQ